MNVCFKLIHLTKRLLFVAIFCASKLYADPVSKGKFDQQQKDVLMGGEVELNERHLIPFTAYIDFEDLQNRMLSDGVDQAWEEYVKALHSGDLLAISQEKDASFLGFATRDLAISMNSFLNVVSHNVKVQLMSGLKYQPGVEAALILEQMRDARNESRNQVAVHNRQEPVKIEFSVAQNSASGFVLPKSLQSSDDPLRIILPSEENIQRPQPRSAGVNLNRGLNPQSDKLQKEKEDLARSQIFWSELNRRWNSLDPWLRLRSIPWTQLPPSSKAKLLIGLYNFLTLKTDFPSDPDFRPDFLDLKFTNAEVEALYHDFYQSRDSGSVLEFKTLKPMGFEPYMAHIERFLKFIRQDRAVLYPGSQLRNDISFHTHLTSPYWPKIRTQEYKKFVKHLKVYIALEGLARGDLSTFAQVKLGQHSTRDYSISTDPEVKDLAVMVGAQWIEIRYFFEDVRKELGFYNQLAHMKPAESTQILKQKISKLLTFERLMLIATLRPNDVFNILDSDILESANLTSHQLATAVQKQVSQMTTDSRAVRFYEIQHKPLQVRSSLDLFLLLHMIKTMAPSYDFHQSGSQELLQLIRNFQSELLMDQRYGFFTKEQLQIILHTTPPAHFDLARHSSIPANRGQSATTCRSLTNKSSD